MIRSRLGPPIVLLLCILALWEGAVRLVGVPVYVLPPPTRIFDAVLAPTTQLWLHTSTTLAESVCGFLLGSAVGLLLGIAIAECRIVRMSILPYVVGSNAVPVIAVAPLVVMWFGYGFTARIVVSAFLCFFPLSINTYRGLEAADSHFRQLFDVYGSTRLQYLLKARLPYAMPFVFAGAKLNATYAVIGAVVAEFIGTTAGLGFGMVHASYNSDTPRLWVYLVVSIGLGIAFYGVVWLTEVIYRRRHS